MKRASSINFINGGLYISPSTLQVSYNHREMQSYTEKRLQMIKSQIDTKMKDRITAMKSHFAAKMTPYPNIFMPEHTPQQTPVMTERSHRDTEMKIAEEVDESSDVYLQGRVHRSVKALVDSDPTVKLLRSTMSRRIGSSEAQNRSKISHSLMSNSAISTVKPLRSGQQTNGAVRIEDFSANSHNAQTTSSLLIKNRYASMSNKLREEQSQLTKQLKQ